MDVQLGPVGDVVLGVEVGREGVGTGSVLTALSADPEGTHPLVVQDLEWRVVEVLGLEGHVGDDVAVVHHPDDGGHSGPQVHRELFVAQSGTPEGMDLLHVAVFQLELQPSYHRQRSPQTRPQHQQPLLPEGLLQQLQGQSDLVVDGQVGQVEPLMHFAVFAPWVIHLLVAKVLDPVDRIHCSPEYHNELVQTADVAGVGLDGGDRVFAQGHGLGTLEGAAGLAGPVHQLFGGAVVDDGVALEGLGEGGVVIYAEGEAGEGQYDQ